VFLGTHNPRLDDKGRLILPAKFREDLAEGVVITRGQERCLYVWPRAEFVRFTEQLRAAPITNRGARDFARMLAAGASDDALDKQGRITLAPGLREYAGLERECAVIGAMTRVEIWSAQAWDQYQSEKEPMFADISEEVLPGVF
jgi:MraZ protein